MNTNNSGVGSSLTESPLKPASESLESVVAKMLQRSERNSSSQGIETGFRDLDAIIGGLLPEQLIVIAGRPAMGRSSLARNIAQYVANVQKRTVAVFSPYESSEMYLSRVLTSESAVDSIRFRTGHLHENDLTRIDDAAQSLNKAPLYIDDTFSITTTEIAARCRELKSKRSDLCLVVVDDVNMIYNADNIDETADNQYVVYKDLQSLAQELQVTIIAASTVSRAVESRKDKRPLVRDLPGSPTTEQIADVVIFVYRDEYYNIESKRRGEVDLIIAKNRFGPTCTIELLFQSTIARFLNWVREVPEMKAKPKAQGKPKTSVRRARAAKKQ